MRFERVGLGVAQVVGVAEALPPETGCALVELETPGQPPEYWVGLQNSGYALGMVLLVPLGDGRELEQIVTKFIVSLRTGIEKGWQSKNIAFRIFRMGDDVGFISPRGSKAAFVSLKAWNMAGPSSSAWTSAAGYG